MRDRFTIERTSLHKSLAILCLYVYAVLSTNVTITSFPQLGVDTVCDNQDVTLMCHTDQTTGNMITWYWSNQSQHGDTITVVARMTEVVFTCMVSDQGREIGRANITVSANGSPPHVDGYNFNPYVLKYEGSNLTLITEISSDLPLSSGEIKWIGFHRPLPSTAVVDNYTTDGVLYSRLSLYELSFEDDTGNYTNIVSNQCGTSSVSVYIDVRKAPIVCNNSGSVAVPQKDIMTVKGESIVLQCLFKGNLKILWPSMSSYWMIGSHGQHTEPTYIMDNSTDPYRIAVYQTCLSEDGSCCNFTNQLNILKVPLGLNGVELKCAEIIDELVYSHSAKIAVYAPPKVTDGPKKHIKTKLNDSISLQCQFRAPIRVTIVVWLKDNLPVKNTQHYNIITTTNPGVDDLIVSNLNINTITSEDEGTYTCYCYYNRTMVTSSKTVVSNKMSTTVHLRKESSGGTDVTWIIVAGIAIASVGVLMVWSVGLTLYCQFVIKRRNFKEVNQSAGSVHDDAVESLVDNHYTNPVAEYGTFNSLKSPLVYKQHRAVQQTDGVMQPQVNTNVVQVTGLIAETLLVLFFICNAV
ncbi:hemicentin-1-like isoform X2 [Dysidea avara]|uniref:hemicentin-1-like isoform X2 n=1 Tax=Dysidea avara TaxID=196820 RepID=UPI0033189AF6